jgi:RimJ/RimL family protein N-acetyltransferase
MPTTLVTPRLRLEPWSEARAALLSELAGLPEVMRFIGDGSLWTAERARAVSAAAEEHWRRHGFGWRAIIERATGRGIGLGMLGFPGEGAGIDPGEYEIGWWLAPGMWGRGLGREAGAALRDEAFSAAIAAPSVVARIQPGNAASLALARSLGLVVERTGTGRLGEPMLVLRLARPG